MFTTFANAAIDAVQSSKKIAVDTFVKHEGLAKALNQFVDSQAEYTKKAVETGFTTATSITSIFSDKSFYGDMAKTMQDAVASTFVKKGK
jgi:hypothetical protein